MKIKVCGMKYPENIQAIAQLNPDFMGLIFYPKSKRFAGGLSVEAALFADTIKKVGVFVNEEEDKIKEYAKKYSFNFLQLHGEESPVLCESLKNAGHQIIKVFSVGEDFNFSEVKDYKDVADYFLFDTKSDSYGGTGKKFNWSIFDKYDNSKGIFLSGGIGPNDADEIKNLKGLNIYALDINSKFEIEPGLKNVEMVREFIANFKF